MIVQAAASSQTRVRRQGATLKVDMKKIPENLRNRIHIVHEVTAQTAREQPNVVEPSNQGHLQFKQTKQSATTTQPAPPRPYAQIIDTEEDYSQDLAVLKSKFAQPLRTILSPSDHLRLFNNLDEVPALFFSFLRCLTTDVANYLWLTYLPCGRPFF